MAALAIPGWLLRFGWGPVTVASLGGYAMWSLLALVAVAIGWYLRMLDVRESRAVADARRSQRLGLARDLHDFVAHDVSGMVAQAQAGQLLARQEPEAAAAFRRIELAGTQALASMDRAVRMLHDELDEDQPRSSAPTLADISGVVQRFSDASAAQVEMAIDAGPDAGVPGAPPRELVATAYRVVAEALTNVRRHAPVAQHVHVSVSRTGAPSTPCLLVTVADDGGSAPAPARRLGGTGIPGLTDRVEALGGTLTAGPDEQGGWRMQAAMPFECRSAEPW